MNNFIKEINEDIAVKGQRLKEKASNGLAAIDLSSLAANSSSLSVRNINGRENSRPKNSLLFAFFVGLAMGFGASSLIASDSDHRRLLVTGAVVAVGAAGAAFYMNNKKGKSIESTPVRHSNANPTSETVYVVSALNKDWEDYMSTKKQIVQKKIELSELPTASKEGMMSHTYVYKVIDFSTMDLVGELSEVQAGPTAQQQFKAIQQKYLQKFCDAVDKAVKEQQDLYALITQV